MILTPENVEKLPRGEAGEGYATVAYTGANKITLNLGDEGGLVELTNTTVPHAKAGDRLYFGQHGTLVRHVTKEDYERDGERVSAGTEQPDSEKSQVAELQEQRDDPERFNPEEEHDRAEGLSDEEVAARQAGTSGQAYDQETLAEHRSETSEPDTSKPLYGNTERPSGLAGEEDPTHPSVQDSNFVAGRTTHEQEEEAAAAPDPTPEDTPRGPTAEEQDSIAGESEGSAQEQDDALRKGTPSDSNVEGAAQAESAEQSTGDSDKV